MENPTENDRKPDERAGCAVAVGAALLTEAAFHNSIRAATYSYGSHLPADAWKDVACDMRDWALKCEANSREYEKRNASLFEALRLAHAILEKLKPGQLENAARRAAVKHIFNEPLAFIASSLPPIK